MVWENGFVVVVAVFFLTFAFVVAVVVVSLFVCFFVFPSLFFFLASLF